MSVLAIMAARNEAGYIDQSLRWLIEDGIEVILIDHGSVDGTREIAERHLGSGLLDSSAPTRRHFWETGFWE